MIAIGPLGHLPGTIAIRVTKCESCSAPSTGEHRQGCAAPLALCVRCKKPVARVTPRPTSDVVDCPSCGAQQLIPSTFVRAA